MTGTMAMAGIELLVDDLDRAVALWTDVLGFDLAERGPALHVAGQVAVVTDGHLAVTLLEPAAAGPGPVLADRTPRLTQIVLTGSAPSGDPEGSAGSAGSEGPDGPGDRAGERAVEAGFSVVPTADGFYLAPETVAGALGAEVAVVVTGGG